jgi:hypothetical protein
MQGCEAQLMDLALHLVMIAEWMSVLTLVVLASVVGGFVAAVVGTAMQSVTPSVVMLRGVRCSFLFGVGYWQDGGWLAAVGGARPVRLVRDGVVKRIACMRYQVPVCQHRFSQSRPGVVVSGLVGIRFECGIPVWDEVLYVGILYGRPRPDVHAHCTSLLSQYSQVRYRNCQMSSCSGQQLASRALLSDCRTRQSI